MYTVSYTLLSKLTIFLVFETTWCCLQGRVWCAGVYQEIETPRLRAFTRSKSFLTHKTIDSNEPEQSTFESAGIIRFQVPKRVISEDQANYHSPGLVVSMVDLEAVVNFEETWQIVAQRQERDDNNSNAAPFASAPGPGPKWVTHGDVAFYRHRHGQVHGTGLRRCGQHERVRCDDRMDVADVVTVVIFSERVERRDHKEEDRCH